MSAARRVVRGWAVVMLLGASAACSPAGEPQPPGAVDCTVLYRPASGSDAGEEEHRLQVRATAPGSEPERLEVGVMTFTAAYTTGVPDGTGLLLAVEDEAGTVLVSHRYQVTTGEALSTEFAGGHGFTGLHHTYHGGAELQHYCVAGD